MPVYRHHKRLPVLPPGALSPAQSALDAFLSSAKASLSSRLAAASAAAAAATPPGKAPPPVVASAPPAPSVVLPTATPIVTPAPPPKPVVATTSTATTPLTTSAPIVKSAPPATKSKAHKSATPSASATPVSGAHKGASPAVIGVVVTLVLVLSLALVAFFVRKRLMNKRRARRNQWDTAARPVTTFINTDKPGGREEEINPYMERLENQKPAPDAFGGPKTGEPYYAEKTLPVPDDNMADNRASITPPFAVLSTQPIEPIRLNTLQPVEPIRQNTLPPTPTQVNSSGLFFNTPPQHELSRMASPLPMDMFTNGNYMLPTSPPPIYASPVVENPNNSTASAPGLDAMPNSSLAVFPAALMPGAVHRDNNQPIAPSSSPIPFLTTTPPVASIASLRQMSSPAPSLTTTPDANMAALYAYPVIRTFVPTLPDELAISTGQRVRVLNSYDDGWALCENFAGAKGVVPLECLDIGLKGVVDEESRISRRASSLFGVAMNF